MPITCIVVDCGSRNNRDKVGFYSVPTVSKHKFLTNKNELSKKQRALWLAAIKRDDLTDSKIKYQKVCSRYFLTSKPASLEDETNSDWVPSQNMGHSAQNVRKTFKDVQRKAKLDKRKLSQNEPQSYMHIDFDNYEPRDGQETGILTRIDLMMEELALKFEQLTKNTIS